MSTTPNTPTNPFEPPIPTGSTGPTDPTGPTGDGEVPVVATEPVGHDAVRVDVRERPAFAVDGFLALFVGLALLGFAIWRVISLVQAANDPYAAYDPSGAAGIGLLDVVPAILAVLLVVLVASSLIVIQPGQTKVVQFFGRYVGTARRQGLTMVLPFTTKANVSIRVNNFETNALKVNDADGNPVEIAAIVVWQVADTAKAMFAVESYANFVKVQSEAALRHVATSHPYDDPEGRGTSLRGSTDVVSGQLAREVAARVHVAGVEIIEVRISHLAYAPEIAQAMLQRQQASAILAARSKIVEGAVGMVEAALNRLEADDVVVLDDERKAAMVSNLLVILCSEAKASPVVNAGSLY